jgi:hypothetical protein
VDKDGEASPSRKNLQLGTALCFWPRRHTAVSLVRPREIRFGARENAESFLTTVTNQLSDKRFWTKWIVSGLPVIHP